MDARRYERLFFFVLGLSVAAGFAAFFPRGESASIGVATTSESATTSTVKTVPTSVPECYVGVVLSRQAVDVASVGDGILEEVLVRPGDAVARGEVLARLDTREIDLQLAIERTVLQGAEAELRRQQLEAERTRKEHERRAALSDLMSSAEVENARLEHEMAIAGRSATEAAVARSQARITQLYDHIARAEIRAPFDATVARRYLDPGALVRPGTPLVRLLSSGSPLARFAVPPEATALLDVGAPVRVEVGELGTALRGEIEHLSPELDPASQLVFVEARLDQDTAPITAGVVARVSRVVDGGLSCLASPRSGGRKL